MRLLVTTRAGRLMGMGLLLLALLSVSLITGACSRDQAEPTEPPITIIGAGAGTPTPTPTVTPGGTPATPRPTVTPESYGVYPTAAFTRTPSAYPTP